jgi:hypothetical protein
MQEETACSASIILEQYQLADLLLISDNMIEQV